MKTVAEAYCDMLTNDCGDCGTLEHNYWKNYLKENPLQKNDVINLYDDMAHQNERDLSSDEDDCFFCQAIEFYEIADWIKINC